MDDSNTVFAFETERARSLEWMPLAVRYKLDLAGIKLSLRQWGEFSAEEREQLIRRPAGTHASTGSYREYLTALLRRRSAEAPAYLPPDPDPEWARTERIPPRILEAARAHDTTAPSLEQWRALSALQRFALFKVTRPGHDGAEFLPAMVEFGLTGRP